MFYEVDRIIQIIVECTVCNNRFTWTKQENCPVCSAHKEAIGISDIPF